MTAPSKVSGSPRPRIRAGSASKPRRYPVSDGAPVEVVEDGPSIAGRLAWLGARLTIRPTLRPYAHDSILGVVTLENAQRSHSNIASGIKTCLLIVVLLVNVKLSYRGLTEAIGEYPGPTTA